MTDEHHDDHRHKGLDEDAQRLVQSLVMSLAPRSFVRCAYCTLTKVAIEALASSLAAEEDLGKRKKMANDMMRAAYKRSHIIAAQVEREGATIQ